MCYWFAEKDLVRLCVCFNYSVYPGASDSHHLMGYWAHRGLPNFCMSVGSNLCFLLCSLCWGSSVSRRCFEGVSWVCEALRFDRSVPVWTCYLSNQGRWVNYLPWWCRYNFFCIVGVNLQNNTASHPRSQQYFILLPIISVVLYTCDHWLRGTVSSARNFTAFQTNLLLSVTELNGV